MTRVMICTNCLKPRYKTKEGFNKEIVMAKYLIPLQNEIKPVRSEEISKCPTCGNNNIKWIKD